MNRINQRDSTKATGVREYMKKEYLEKVIITSTFLIPSIFVFVGVTVLYVYKFYSSYSETNLLDIIIYCLIYVIISVFLQFVIFVNARRQILNQEKYQNNQG